MARARNGLLDPLIGRQSELERRLASNSSLSVGGTSILAEICIAQGHLGEALGAYQQSLQLVTGPGQPVVRGTADLYLGMCELLLEQGSLSTALGHLLRSEELGEQAAEDAYQYRSRVTRARIKEIQGDLDGALDLLEEAKSVYTTGVLPNIRPVEALTARLWLRQGRLAEASGRLRAQDLSPDDELSFLREFDHITLARLLLAQFRNTLSDSTIRDQERLLPRLLGAAEEGGRTGSVIEILLLQTLAHEAQGNVELALAPMHHALTLAQPEGYVQIFLDEGETMRNLLRQIAGGSVSSPYAGRLLAAFDGTAQAAVSSTQPAAGNLSEPLTAREVESLALIAAGMRNQQIADHLFISRATVKRHIANLFGKLGVGHRTEAVVKANELNLL